MFLLPSGIKGLLDHIGDPAFDILGPNEFPITFGKFAIT